MIERMPKWLICIPLVVQWLVLAMRYRSLTLPTVANPGITSGGLVGEGKLEYFQAMGPLACAASAAHCSVLVLGKTAAAIDETLQNAWMAMRLAGLGFPVIVKPDLGLCGYGVRLLADTDAMRSYIAEFPAQETIVLQQWLAQENEAGIFYMRTPDAPAGCIIGLALRYFPQVTGDGRQTIAELAQASSRTRRWLKSKQHASLVNQAHIPLLGETVRLATIGSTRVGGLYRNGKALITPQLTMAIDAIAHDMTNFHFGRFDVRFDTPQRLGLGKGFAIMEVNGAGSEAIEAWDPDTNVWTAFQTIFAKQRALFAIGNAMRSKGFKPIGWMALAKLNHRQNQLIDRYPSSN